MPATNPGWSNQAEWREMEREFKARLEETTGESYRARTDVARHIEGLEKHPETGWGRMVQCKRIVDIKRPHLTADDKRELDGGRWTPFGWMLPPLNAPSHPPLLSFTHNPIDWLPVWLDDIRGVFLHHLYDYMLSKGVNTLLSVFQEWDRDNDNIITFKELQQVTARDPPHVDQTS